MQRTGLHQFVQLEFPATRVARRAQARFSVANDRVHGVTAVLGPGQRHFARRGETGEVIDMAVGLVHEHPFAQPHHGLHTEPGTQLGLVALAGHTRVTIRVQQALFGNQQGTLPIHVDGSAFQNEIRPIAVETLYLADLLRHSSIEIPREVQATLQPAPGVEVPVDASPTALVIHHDGRPNIAHPCVIAGDFHQPHRRRQLRPGVGILPRGNPHPDGFTGANRRGNRRKGRLRRLGT